MKNAMKTMRRAFAVIAMLAFGTTAVMAQDTPPAAPVPPDPPGPPSEVEGSYRLDRLMSRMTDELELSEEQATQIRAIMAERMERQREFFEARNERQRAMREQMRSTMEEMRKETDGKVKEVLTEEQATKYDAFMKDRGPRRGHRGMRERRGRR